MGTEFSSFNTSISSSIYASLHSFNPKMFIVGNQLFIYSIFNWNREFLSIYKIKHAFVFFISTIFKYSWFMVNFFSQLYFFHEVFYERFCCDGIYFLIRMCDISMYS